MDRQMEGSITICPGHKKNQHAVAQKMMNAQQGFSSIAEMYYEKKNYM
jgi:hypothetical protein